MQGARPGGPADAYTDPTRRASLMALLDDGFENLSGRIDAARSAGFDWAAVTEPFVQWGEDGRAEAHVGVLEHRLVLDGDEVLSAGIHAVVTRSDRRGRGLARRTLAEALRWADVRYDVAKLGTDLPDVYAKHGFVARPLHKFGVDHAGGEGAGRPLEADDHEGFLALCAARDPVSYRFGSLDPGWLIGIDLALQGRSLADLVVLEDLDAVVDWSVRADGTLELHEVIAPELPPLADVLQLAPAHRQVELFCCPDRLAPDATVIETPEAGVWMIRPGTGLSDFPLGVSRLAEH